MNDIIRAFAILEDTILNKKRHKDYKRVTDLADKYQKLFTGEDVDSLLVQFTKREDKEMFEQRKLLYQSVMPAVTENISNVFIKPLRSNRIFASIEFEGDNGEKYAELVKVNKEFWFGDSDSGVNAYLRSRWFDLVRFDPNAFIVVSFDDFDNTKEKAKPYPIEYSSKEAINYQYTNGKLDWLIVETAISYKKKKINQMEQSQQSQLYDLKKGYEYVIYIDNNAIKLTEVDPIDKITDIVNPEFSSIGERLFVMQLSSPKSGRVPAIRVGAKSDTVTNGRTNISILHAAMPFFMKELKTGSELDISMALHAFPQKIQYAQRCNGDKQKSIPACRNGVTVNGEVCPACNGTGFAAVHTTGQDIIYVPFPREGDNIVDLDKLLVYKSPDIGLIKFQDEYVDKLTEKARKAVFGGTTMIQKQGLQTATAADYAMDDTYDALRPFADKFSAMWLSIVELNAIFTDNIKGLNLYHRLPNDFKLKTLQQLFEERKAAVDADVPQQVLDAIDTDIQEIIYSDDQDTLTKIKIKSKFMPFTGKTKEEIQTLLIQNKTTRYLETLYTHFDIIFEAIDNELGDEFYTFAYEKQVAEVKKRVQILINEINNERMSKIPIPIEPDTKIA